MNPAHYEYRVIPAPPRGLKGKGVKGAEGRFAHALEQLMNEMGTQGWEYLRAETLPSEERAGLTAKTTVFRSVLVFRRPCDTDVSAFDPKLLEAPEPHSEPADDSASPPEQTPDEAAIPQAQQPTAMTLPESDEDDDTPPGDLSGPARARAQLLSQGNRD